MNDQELLAKRKKYFTHTAIHYYKEPLHLTRAQGTRVWDSNGKEYLDAICGIVTIAVGHNHPKIKKALIERFEADGIQHPSVLYLSEPAILLAEKLANLAPEGLNRVFLPIPAQKRMNMLLWLPVMLPVNKSLFL